MTKEDQNYLEDMAFNILQKLDQMPIIRLVDLLQTRGVPKKEIDLVWKLKEME